MTYQERAQRIRLIQQLPDELDDIVLSLSREQLSTPYRQGEWTVAQNVHHLADAHMNVFIRCKLMLTEDDPPLKPFDQDAWAAEADAVGADISASLRLLRGLHARWVMFWENLPEEAWSRTGRHPEAGVLTLEKILEIYSAHGQAHLDQIQRTLAAGGVRHAG